MLAALGPALGPYVAIFVVGFVLGLAGHLLPSRILLIAGLATIFMATTVLPLVAILSR